MTVITKFKYFISNIRSDLLLKQQKVLLGRWTIDYCENKINKKIDLSNEDHCGTCNINHDSHNKPIIKNINNINRLIFFETM